LVIWIRTKEGNSAVTNKKKGKKRRKKFFFFFLELEFLAGRPEASQKYS
jgi:hypothetical protein